MRMVGTALVCVLAAFGAAFLVARAADHQTPARAATPPASTTTPAAVAPTTTVNHELVSEFTPVVSSLKPKPKPRRRHAALHPSTSSVVSSSPVTSPTPTYTAPVQTPAYSSPAATPSSPTTQHKHSGGGSGTTTIGG